MTANLQGSLIFTRGVHFYQVAKSHNLNSAYIGFCDGAAIVQADDKAKVVRFLIKNTLDEEAL